MNAILFTIGPLSSSTMWVMVTIGAFISLGIIHHLSAKTRFKLSLIFQNLTFIALITLLFSRATYIFLNWDRYLANQEIKNILLSSINILDRGLSFWGAIIGILVCTKIITKKINEPFLGWMDNISIALVASTIFGNIGAFFEGLNYGRESNLPWAVIFDSGSIKYTVPIHPTQIYAAIVSSLIFVIAWKLRKSKWASSLNGRITFFISISYLSGIFLEGFVRGDDPVILIPQYESTFFTLLRIEQWFSLIAIIVILISFQKYKKQQLKKETFSESVAPPTKNTPITAKNTSDQDSQLKAN